ncbi:DUF1109 family protein [Bradyrhizobium sp. Pear77]|uniref:NrsF family protein n=1 Tax=Bradyrhizobium altum TaxID=1571202 RepID=UPI001E437CA4|nr:NrsF family protein [Bradyrhizobium altum]MCC8955385.1 DUF1109 family protein [Bradyrhizobium altum]
METETLLEALAADTLNSWKPEKSIRLALIAGNVIAGIAFFVGIGFRPDILFAMGTSRFLVKFAVTLPLVFAATAAMLRAAQPGTSFGVRGWALAISPLVLVLAVLIEIVTVPPPFWGSRMVGTHALNCLTLIPLLSIGPLACFLLALREGAPTRPGLAGAIAGLAASGIAATFYATNCTDDSPLFVVIWYPLAVGFVTLIGFLSGRRFLRW